MSATSVAITPTDADDLSLTLYEASVAGWGHTQTLRRRIKAGKLPAERVDDRGTFIVRQSDLMRQPDLVRLRKSKGLPALPTECPVAAVPADLDDLAALAARIVSTWPRLSAERKSELGRLLASA